MRQLILRRPLIAFDLETTGLDLQKDRIVDIACIKILPDLSRQSWCRRLNPGRPISSEATRVHGISDADVACAPTFADIATELFNFIDLCDLTGYNIEKFDMPMLRNAFMRLDIAFPSDAICVVDAYRIFCQKEPRDLSAATFKFCGRKLEGAHGAEADATAAADVLFGQAQAYEDLPLTIEALHALTHPKKMGGVDCEGKFMWANGEAVCAFGKHRDKSLRMLAETLPDYLRWVSEANFSPEVQALCRDALAGRFPTPPKELQAPSSAAQDHTHRARETQRQRSAPCEQPSLFDD